MTLLDGLLAYFPLNEERGDARSHNGQWHLVPTNHVGSVTGKVGTYARSFNGTDQYLRVDDSAFQMGDIDFTLCAWVYANTLPDPAAIAGKWNAGASPREYALRYASSRFQLLARASDDSGETSVAANTFGAPSTSTWYFVVVQHDATNNLLKISVNGGTLDTTAFSGGTNKAHAKFAVGAYQNPSTYWDGRIEGVGIWERLLTTDEITALYNSGNGLAYPFGLSLLGTLQWRVLIDWDGDNVCETDEGARLIGIQSVERGKPGLHDDPAMGSLELLLDNADGRYNWWRPTSPLYGRSGVNRRFELQCQAAGVTYPVFAGRIVDPRAGSFQAAGIGNKKPFSLVVNDGWRVLQNGRAEVALSEDISQRTALSTLLNAIGWTGSDALWVLGTSALGTGTILGGIYANTVDLGYDAGDNIPYWWAFTDESAAANLLDLARAHWGRVHINAAGRLVYRTISADNGTPNDYTLTDAVLQEAEVAFPIENVRNRISVGATPRELATALADIWTSSEVFQLAPGESREFWVEYTGPDGERVPAKNVTTPAATTDYTGNSAEDGSGTDLTANIGITLTIYSASSHLVVSNTGAANLCVTLLKLRGKPITGIDAQPIVEQDLGSQATYGLQELEMSLRWQQLTGVAQDFADYAARSFPDPQAVMTVRFVNRPDMLAYDLGDKVLDATSVGTGDKFRIGRLTHELPEGTGGQKLTTTWYLYPCLPDDAWILGTHTLGETTKLGF